MKQSDYSHRIYFFSTNDKDDFHSIAYGMDDDGSLYFALGNHDDTAFNDAVGKLIRKVNFKEAVNDNENSFVKSENYYNTEEANIGTYESDGFKIYAQCSRTPKNKGMR